MSSRYSPASAVKAESFDSTAGFSGARELAGRRQAAQQQQRQGGAEKMAHPIMLSHTDSRLAVR